MIVVNNDHLEKSALAALEHRFSFHRVENESNSGFGAGSNRGAMQAKGNILGFINPDTLWTGRYLESIAQVFDTRRDIGILGMNMRDVNGKEELWGAGRAPSLKNLFLNNVLPFRQGYWKKQGLSFPDRVSGGALFIRKEIFTAMNGFDEQFFLYFEDVDLCTRVRNAGYRVARDTAYPITHLGGQSKQSVKNQKQHFYNSQLKYYKKHRPVWERRALSLLQRLFC